MFLRQVFSQEPRAQHFGSAVWPVRAEICLSPPPQASRSHTSLFLMHSCPSPQLDFKLDEIKINVFEALSH